MTWHILDTGSIWLKEFASSLGALTPTRSWVPEIRNLGAFLGHERVVALDSPKLEYTTFPLQRGYSRPPLSNSSFLGRRVVQRLLRMTPLAANPVLVCTSPFYASVAEVWPGPVVYYLTDHTGAYQGMNPDHVRELDRRVCRVARLVCPNSHRLGDYLRTEAGCEPAKMLVIANATRAENVMERPLFEPGRLPDGLEDLPRPVAGVIGNMAGNLDWLLLRELVDRTADFSWAFVGPVDMVIPDAPHAAARRDLMSRGDRVRFTGSKPYGELWKYGRAFDVALMPYLKQEPTYSGSPTRFFEHLAATRPIVSTRGMAEVCFKEPLVRLVDTAQEAAEELNRLRDLEFRDNLEELRWEASFHETWDARAETMVTALTGRTQPAVHQRKARAATSA